MTQDRLCALRLRAKWPGHPDSFSPGLFTWPSQETLGYWGSREFQLSKAWNMIVCHTKKSWKLTVWLCGRRLLLYSVWPKRKELSLMRESRAQGFFVVTTLGYGMLTPFYYLMFHSTGCYFQFEVIWDSGNLRFIFITSESMRDWYVERETECYVPHIALTSSSSTFSSLSILTL